MNTKVSHEWGMDLFIIEGNGATKIIVVTKRWNKTSKKQVIFCYDLFNEATKEKEDPLFTAYPNLLTI